MLVNPYRVRWKFSTVTPHRSTRARRSLLTFISPPQPPRSSSRAEQAESNTKNNKRQYDKICDPSNYSLTFSSRICLLTCSRVIRVSFNPSFLDIPRLPESHRPSRPPQPPPDRRPSPLPLLPSPYPVNAAGAVKPVAYSLPFLYLHRTFILLILINTQWPPRSSQPPSFGRPYHPPPSFLTPSPTNAAGPVEPTF